MYLRGLPSVSSAGNMLPEVAYMKLCWTLGQTDDRDEVRRIMRSRIGDEFTDRERDDGYLVFQGAIREVQEFLRTIKRWGRCRNKWNWSDLVT